MKEQVARAITTARAEGERGPLLPALHAVQAALGYVPDEAIGMLAEEFNLSRADVYGVVTFYRDFHREPAARVQVRLCAAEACRSVGSERLAADVQEGLGIALGAVGADRAVGLDEVFCLGNCALGPSAMVDGTVVGRASVERILQLVAAALRPSSTVDLPGATS